ncbi:unnamed protein product [Thelazia callipaeda]|uniref:Uncharacterized protein n=1 Tax=Thelazia callipaeda TaxID=103827 RepID=A0A0N5CUL2_THECL|nr:unnamed protein product [Thelazia callipaeda]
MIHLWMDRPNDLVSSSKTKSNVRLSKYVSISDGNRNNCTNSTNYYAGTTESGSNSTATSALRKCCRSTSVAAEESRSQRTQGKSNHRSRSKSVFAHKQWLDGAMSGTGITSELFKVTNA